MNFERRLNLYHSAICELLFRQQPVWLLTGLHGNIGDHLIWRGTERILQIGGVDYKAIATKELSIKSEESTPGTLVIPGSGALTKLWHEWLPDIVIAGSDRFERVVILPSEYEPSVPVVQAMLSRHNVYAFARDAVSYAKIKFFGRTALAPDPALWAIRHCQSMTSGAVDRASSELLLAMRTDAGSTLLKRNLHPCSSNNDISLTSKDLDEFLRQIERASTIVTDRLHVAIAGILCGRHVDYIDPYNDKITRHLAFNFRDEFSNRSTKRDHDWLRLSGYLEVGGLA